MFKKIIAGVLTIVMLFTVMNMPITNMQVFAFDNFKVEVTKDSAPIREGYYESKKAIKWVKKGTVLTVVGEKRNLKLKLWYKVDGGYIYSGNVKKIHDHKIVFNKYGSQHPHYAEYKCKYCDNGAYCGSETTKVQGCEKCYPKSTSSSKGTSSQKANTNKVPNTNVVTKADVLVPKYDSLQEEAEKKLQTPVHEDNYKFSEYSTTHPHYAIYRCSCGKSYQDTSKTQKMTGCNTCYPPHEDSYEFVGYNETHPHKAIYECSCGKVYLEDKTTKVKTCIECYPYGYGNDHFCDFVYTGKNLNEHPHYAINKCIICGDEEVDYQKNKESSSCNICNNPFKDNVENVSDFHGRIYDLSTGEIINIKEADALYDYAEDIHVSLDILGLFPVYGEVFDGINALYYIVEGEYVDAVLSGAAMFPFIGVLCKNGKIYKKTGTVAVDIASESTEVISERAIKEVLSENSKNLTNTAKNILLNYEKYSDETLKVIKDISQNKSVKFSKIFYKNQLLISRNYMGTVTTPTGLKYAYNLDDGKNSIYHILDKHGYSKVGKSGKGVTYFNVDGKEIIELIDDVYENSSSIKTKVKKDNLKTRTSHIISAERVIGSEGEDKLLLVLEGDSVISAYPTFLEDFMN